MKICCDKCERPVMKKLLNLRETSLTLHGEIFGDEKLYLCSECYIKLKNFLNEKEDIKNE